MTERPGPVDDPDAGLQRAEEVALEKSVQSVGRRGPGPVVAAALIVAAFVIGLVRPWDWLGPGAGTPPGEARVAPAGPAGSVGPPGAPSGPGNGASPGNGAGTDVAPTCGFPQSWRSATDQRWAGRPARVWTAVEVAEASGPEDPAIPFQVVAGEDFTSLGWCAPVEGAERPPEAARGSLFRIEDGAAVEVPFDRLEPAEPDALGELWAPPAGPDGRHPEWTPGRYVIRLGTRTGAYVRYLGLEIGPSPVRVPPSSTPGPSAPGPGASPTATAAS